MSVIFFDLWGLDYFFAKLKKQKNMLKTSVLVRQVYNLHDARYCAGMGVSYISMPLNKDGVEISSPEKIKEISEWLSGIKILGDVDSEIPENISVYTVDGIETSDSRILKRLAELQQNPLYLTINVSAEELMSPAFKGLLDQLKDSVDFFICLAEDKLQNYDLNEIKSLNESYDLFWGFTFSSESILKFIDECQPKGVVLQGSEEIKTGVNDFDYLADLLEALDTDEYV